MKRLGENLILNTENKSHLISARITIPDTGGRDVIVAQGGETGAGPSTPPTATCATATTSPNAR